MDNNISIIDPEDQLPEKAVFMHWCNTVSTELKQLYNVTFIAHNSLAMSALNGKYRGKFYPTNILTFPHEDKDNIITGDIYLCHDIVLKEALSDGIDINDHYAHLTTHGLLHLIGLDHQNPASQQAMEQLEVKILSQLGINNPYEKFN
tara:strand:+ start:3136 stop:3579 length:444 start_codon:yes stop_codon:yes gene_type:complete